MCSLLEARSHCAANSRKTQTLSIPAPKLSAANSVHDPGLRRSSPSQWAELLLGFLGWCDRKLSFFLSIWINLNNRHFVKKWRGHFMMCSQFSLNLPLEKKPQNIWTQEPYAETEGDQRLPQAVPEVCGDFNLVPDCTEPVQHIPAFATPAVYMQWWFTEEELSSFLRQSLIDPHSEISSEENPSWQKPSATNRSPSKCNVFVFLYIFRCNLGFSSFLFLVLI